MEEQKRLRVGMDNDLSDFSQMLRAQTGLLKAVAKTQSEHTKVLSQHTKVFEAQGHHLRRLEERVGVMEGAVGSLKTGVERIIEMVGVLIERDRER